MKKPLKILQIEDNPGDARLVLELLKEANGSLYELKRADRWQRGIDILLSEDFDVLLLDLELPDSFGLETVVKTMERVPRLPVIVMSSLEDESIAAEAVRRGAQDYLVKGRLDGHLLTRSITYAIERKQNQMALQAAAEEKERLYGQEQLSRAKLESYAERLALLHKIGLSLNRESDKRSMLDSVLQAAARLTSAGIGAIILVDDNGETDLISIYYAPWYGERCQLRDDATMLHKRIDRFVPSGKESVRIDFSEMTDPLELPAGHSPLDGLLIGAIRDARGSERGYFMLSHKEKGVQFTPEDEETVSLLASQSSVALISAENFDREHAVAETLQSSLLPKIPRRSDLEVGLVYHSASKISRLGGDFYDFIELDDGKLAIAVGDVCGKGLEAATATAMIKYMLWAYVAEQDDPGSCLTRLNATTHRQVPMEKFVTLFLGVIDPAAGTMKYSSAGHPLPIVSTPDEIKQLDSQPGVPLGVLANYEFQTSTATIEPGASLSIFTDGLIEARMPGAQPFGESGIIKSLDQHRGLPSQKTAECLIDDAVQYSGGHLQDDIALVMLKLL